MKIFRRRFLQLAAGAAALPVASRWAWAQAYPARPVHLIVGFAAGGPQDITMRLMCQWLSERLGQSFIVENRPGASGNVGAETVVRAAPDGYTLLSVSSPNAINATLYSNLNFNFIRDIAPVGSIMRVPLVMEVNPEVPVKTVPELIAYMKANPGKISYASAGIGTPQHVSAELFKMMTGVEMVQVPYRGAAPALQDLIAGQVQIMIDTSPASMQFIKAGKVRALAVTTATRAAVLPDLPTVADFLPGYEATSWFGIGAPAKTPPDIIEKLNKEINAGLADPKIKARLMELGGILIPGSPADFGKLIATDTEKWAKVIKFSGAKPG
ncbi:MAG TPA: tripartite tricarboxylate transporter substrate binding protein [Pseudolabrys sp.]